MAGYLIDPTRAPVAFGRRGVPQLFEELRRPETGSKQRALASLCDLMHDPQRVYQTVTGGFLEQLKVLLQNEDPSVRTQTCELLHILTGHSIGRQAVLSSSLLSPLSLLLDDSVSSCRTNVHRVLNRLSLLSAGAEALLSLVPKLMLKLREEEEDEEEEEEEVQVLLLSTLTACSRLDSLPALASDGVSLLGRKLRHPSPNIRREAAAAMMALSVSADGKRLVCEEEVLPVLVKLLQDQDLELQANAAGVIMYTVIITDGKKRCMALDVIPVLLELASQPPDSDADPERVRRRKALVMNCLRALTSLAEAPAGRRLLTKRLPQIQQLAAGKGPATHTPLLDDRDIQRDAQTAVRVITWEP